MGKPSRNGIWQRAIAALCSRNVPNSKVTATWPWIQMVAGSTFDGWELRTANIKWLTILVLFETLLLLGSTLTHPYRAPMSHRHHWQQPQRDRPIPHVCSSATWTSTDSPKGFCLNQSAFMPEIDVVCNRVHVNVHLRKERHGSGSSTKQLLLTSSV